MPGRLEGLGWYTHEIVRRLVAQRPDDEFVFFFDRPVDPRFVYRPNVTPVVLFPPARHPLLWYAWFEWALPAALRRFRPDVFFSPDSYLSLRATTPSVMSCHDLVPLHSPEQVPPLPRRFYQRFLPQYLRRADHIVTVSEYVRQDLVQTLLLDPAKITTVYNGCRDGFRPLSKPEQQAVRAEFSAGHPYFFYTGAIHPRKNIPRLIRAFDAFKDRTDAPVKLLLAGRFAWQTGEVSAAHAAARHRADIIFLGYVADELLPRLLGAALALTYVSLNEGFGLPLVEAFQCEVPVLTANVTALPEVAGDAALLVDPFSEPAIAAALEKLWSDPVLRQQLVDKGRLRRPHFDWDSAAIRIGQLLQQVAP